MVDRSVYSNAVEGIPNAVEGIVSKVLGPDIEPEMYEAAQLICSLEEISIDSLVKRAILEQNFCDHTSAIRVFILKYLLDIRKTQ